MQAIRERFLYFIVSREMLRYKIWSLKVESAPQWHSPNPLIHRPFLFELLHKHIPQTSLWSLCPCFSLHNYSPNTDDEMPFVCLVLQWKLTKCNYKEVHCGFFFFFCLVVVLFFEIISSHHKCHHKYPAQVCSLDCLHTVCCRGSKLQLEDTIHLNIILL